MTDPNTPPRGDDLVTDAIAEVKAMAKEGAHHPSTKPVLAGAAVGVVASLGPARRATAVDPVTALRNG